MYVRELLLLCFVYSACQAKGEPVLELTDEDFYTQLAEHETTLVMFYAPWCGHCKELKPEFTKAAKKLLKNDPPVVLAKIDCTEKGKQTCEKYDVSGYPTLKIFRHGELAQDYDGGRDADGIYRHMRLQAGPSSKEISNEEALEKFLKKEEDVSLVGFFEKDSDLKKAFIKLADKLRSKLKFVHIRNKTFMDEKGIHDGVMVYRPYYLRNKFEDDGDLYDGLPDPDAIDNFTIKSYHGLAGLRYPDTKHDYPNPVVVVYFDVDYGHNPKGTTYWRNRVLKVAKEYKDKMHFGISNKDDFHQELLDFGVDSNKATEEPIACARDSQNRKFVMTDGFSSENLAKFVEDVLGGKLEPYIKSQTVPKLNSKPVKIAVALNFDQVVTNNGKDTMVEFYAPWCGHCKKFAKVYAVLGDKMKNENVEIVKMDGTANDVPENYTVEGYPTIYWVPKNGREKPVLYEGEKKLWDMIKYIAKHATEELKGYSRDGLPTEYKVEL